MQLGEPLQPQLEGVLDGDEPFGGRDVGGHGPEERGLAGPDAAADDERLLGPHGGAKELTQSEIERAFGDKVVGVDPQVTVPADRHAGLGRQRHQREEARPVRHR